MKIKVTYNGHTLHYTEESLKKHALQMGLPFEDMEHDGYKLAVEKFCWTHFMATSEVHLEYWGTMKAGHGYGFQTYHYAPNGAYKGEIDCILED